MTLPNLTLTMDKRTNSQQKLHLRQSERGLVLAAQLTDYDGTPYDLTGMLVRFKDAKAGGKSVSDDNVTIATDPKTGIITYPIHSQVFAANGIGWFEIYNTDGTLVDSTQNIPIVVDKDISGVIDNSDYISALSGLKAQLQGIVNSAQQTLDNAVSGANTAASNANQAAQAAQTLANDIPNDPKYKGTPGKDGTDGKDGKDGLSITLSDTAITAGDMTTEPDGTLVIDSNDSLYQAETGKWVLRGNIKGSKGDTGTGIQLKGSADSVDKLPATGNTVGDTYLVQGHLYIWENDVWADGGELQGPKGDDGKSAYQVWLDAGNTGTEADFLTSLKGATGPAGKDGTTPDLTPYLKSADAAATYQTATQADAKYITQFSKTYSGDLNNLGTGGSYIIAPGLTNAPNATDYFFVNVQAQGVTTDLGVNQIATDISTGEVCGRTKAAGHSWTFWSHMVTSDAMQAALDAKTQLVADETTATSNSTTNTTVLYLVPEAS